MVFKNIMVAYDGSPHAKRAFNTALAMAEKSKAKITAVTCIGKYYSGSWFVDDRLADLDFKRQYKAAREEHSRLGRLAGNSDLEFESKIMQESKTVKGLAGYAESSKADLIVMGSHGRTGWSKILLGSVASGLLQTAKCPVLIVK